MSLAFPDGFRSTKGLVKVVGLQPSSNPVHAAVWASFSNIHTSSVIYQFASIDQIAPSRKAKVQDKKKLSKILEEMKILCVRKDGTSSLLLLHFLLPSLS